METSITYIKCKNQQGSPLYHTEISMFLRGRTSQQNIIRKAENLIKILMT